MAESEYDWRPAFDLLLDEARRSIDQQMASVREARQRAGALLGYGSIVAAALGFSADGDLGLFGWLAIAGFLVVGAAALYVLYPRVFHHDLRAALIDAWFEDPKNAGTDHMLRSAAMGHDANYAFNLRNVVNLHRGIMVAVGGLIVESVALVMKLVL